MWFSNLDAIEPNRRFVAIFNDGSGASFFKKLADGTFTACDADDDEIDEPFDNLDVFDDYSHFAYLPDGYLLWAERCEDDLAPPLDPEAQAV